MTARLTVVVPTYRRPALLRRALRSITAQEVEGVDVVVRVYDNASGDDTESVVRAATTPGTSIDYIGRPENVGIIRNFSGAIRDVDSEFFTVISDDDVLLPGALARNLQNLKTHPAAVAWNGVVLSGSETRLVGLRPARQWRMGVTDGLSALDLISRNVRPETTGMVFRTAIVDSEFCPADDAFMAQDLLWLCSAARQGAIGVSPEPSAILYVHEHSLSASRRASQAVDVLFPSIPRLCDILERWPIPAPARQQALEQFQQHYGVHGLLLVLYRAALAGDTEGLASVAATAGRYAWMSPVLARVAWARTASSLRLRAALLAEQIGHGNPWHKLDVYRWNTLHWGRYRESLQM